MFRLHPSTNLDVGDIGLELLQALLYLGVLLGHLLVLGLPLIALLLESLNLALEVAGLDVGLAKSIKREKRLISLNIVKKRGSGVQGCGRSGAPHFIVQERMIFDENVLLVGLAKSLVSFLGLLFKKLKSPCQRLVLSALLRAILGGALQLLNLGLKLVHLTF